MKLKDIGKYILYAIALVAAITVIVLLWIGFQQN